MRTCTRLLLSATLAACLLASVAGSAFANRLAISPGERGFRLVWTAFLVASFVGEETILITCPVTLEGTFSSSTFAKTRGLQIGNVTRAAVTEASCRGTRSHVTRNERGEEIVVQEEIPAKIGWLTATLPWHVQYMSFEGVLPVISGIHLTFTGAAIRAYELPSGFECLFKATTEAPMRWIALVERAGVITSIKADETSPLTVREGFLCLFERLLYSGQATVTQLGTRATLAVRLI